MKKQIISAHEILRQERLEFLKWAPAEIDRLKAENARLRAALEAAPEPFADAEPEIYAMKCARWHRGPRAEDLKGESHE